MNPKRRGAFTIMETVAAFALLGVVLVMVAKLGFTSMKERARSLAKQTALEHLQNLLESARTVPWDKLTPEWAAATKLPEDWNFLLPDAELDLKVEPEKNVPLLKRVTAAIRWKNVEGVQVEVQLVGLFGSRVSASKEKQP